MRRLEPIECCMSYTQVLHEPDIIDPLSRLHMTGRNNTTTMASYYTCIDYIQE